MQNFPEKRNVFGNKPVEMQLRFVPKSWSKNAEKVEKPFCFVFLFCFFFVFFFCSCASDFYEFGIGKSVVFKGQKYKQCGKKNLR